MSDRLITIQIPEPSDRALALLQRLVAAGGPASFPLETAAHVELVRAGLAERGKRNTGWFRFEATFAGRALVEAVAPVVANQRPAARVK